MGTKWKNKIIIVLWAMLFTFGLMGILSGLNYGSEYIKKDYFKTSEFEHQLNHFIDHLRMFELNYVPIEEAKQSIIVTSDEIEEHRFRYGNLQEQIWNIRDQYEQRIQEAQETENQDLADLYIEERDKKIEDITNNFKSDEHVRAKIIKEKEQRMEEAYLQMESNRIDFVNFKAAFVYYLKETTTGEVYTNITNNGDVVEGINNPQDMAFIRSYPSSKQGYLSSNERYNYYGYDAVMYDQGMNGVPSNKQGTFEGQIAVPKSALAASTVLSNYHRFLQEQIAYFIYTLSSIIALALSIFIYRRKLMILPYPIDSWRPYYYRIPLDLRVIILIVIGIVTLNLLFNFNLYYLIGNLYFLLKETLFQVVVTTMLLALTLLQGKFLLERFKEKGKLQADWQKSILMRSYDMVKAAFLNRSLGTQIVVLLFVVFAVGAGMIIVLMSPEIIFLYALFCFVIGLPMLILLIKRMGYFNQIAHNASEVVQGKMEPDLPVKGKSVLAKLAGDINSLKHGVKTSQKEQAKSERLKTELITNVSHDLRTPLTSIITYTELLKSQDLTNEDRDAYIHIIDRKSKRLKVLIDDLFEASKMASGSVELVKEKVDLFHLLQQALAEYNETISESTLQFRVTPPENPIYAVVDGQKLWRVFENLIGNILKYSLENTRVYISLSTSQNKAVITFKNTTKYELSENVDELFERFKRGDTSRHTEGSGLGLAIAKSIVDLHDGSLDIGVDGDLFKVTITLDTLK